MTMADTLPHSDKKETSSAKAITFQLPTAEYAALAKKGKENHRRNLQENNTEFPAIDWGYLAWLWNTTIQVWPDIRDSTEAEQQYYQSKRANAPSYFGQLCRTYGPVLPQLAPSISKKGFWVRRYRVGVENPSSRVAAVLTPSRKFMRFAWDQMTNYLTRWPVLISR